MTEAELNVHLRRDIRERIDAIWRADSDGIDRLLTLAIECIDRGGPNAKDNLRELLGCHPSLRKLSSALAELERLGPELKH